MTEVEAGLDKRIQKLEHFCNALEEAVEELQEHEEALRKALKKYAKTEGVKTLFKK